MAASFSLQLVWLGMLLSIHFAFGATCGDGFRTAEEDCDDGNQVAGDGCSPLCKIEYAFYCVGGGPSRADTCFRMQREGKHHANNRLCTHCQLRLSENKTLQTLPVNHPDRSISLITTHYAAAAKEASYINNHYREAEVAIASNLANPAFVEVIVLFEGHKDNGCDALKTRVLKAMAKASLEQVAVFRCVMVPKQPSYREMFLKANSLNLKGAVAVIANGDCGFDSTLALASNIPHGFVAVLVVTGGVRYHIDRWARLPLKDQNRHLKIQKLFADYSGVKPTKEGARCDTRVPIDSWDGYVFRLPIPDLSPVLMKDELTMNMVNAENIAGSAIINAGLSLSRKKNIVCAFCQINVIHFHSSRQRTHAADQPNLQQDGYIRVNTLYNHSAHPEISFGRQRSASMFCHIPGHETKDGKAVWDRNGPYNTAKDTREMRYGKHRWILLDEESTHGIPTWKRIKTKRGS